jgi:cell wall-associated NlpC family hydrolase
MFDHAPDHSSHLGGPPTPSPVQVMRDSRPIVRASARGVVLLSCLLALAAFTTNAAAAPAGFDTGRSTARDGKAGGDPWAWSSDAQAWAQSSRVLSAGLVRRGPTAKVTRGQFLAALLRVQAMRDVGRRGLLSSPRPAPALADAAAGSAQARAVAHGWLPARAGRFDASAPITADDAALAMASALGLRPTVSTLALALQRELPGARLRWSYAAAHAIVRTLGLRYNVKDPNDRLELGPSDALNVGHGAYMLHVAATSIDSWKLDEATTLASTFDLPNLGPNQQLVLNVAVRQLGQPYVWAGETEGQQAEGKGGFDCSGFTIRVINQAGVPAAQLAIIAERTTYTQSAIPAARRIPVEALQPGDAMFFGDDGPSSTPTQNFHAGVYMGNGWFIHSSGGNGGVAINSLDGWWGEHYSWGRRALLSS